MRERLRTEARVSFDLVRARARHHLRRAGGTAPIVANSLPKSGTHLLIKLLEQLPGVSQVRLQLSQMTHDRFAARAGEPTVDLGVVWPAPVSRPKVYRTIQGLPPGTFISAHVPYDPELSRFMEAVGTRMVVLTRDPRDVAVSGARYLATAKGHPLHGRFASMSESERLMATIVGIPAEGDGPGMRNLRKRVISVTEWGISPVVHTTRYEDLVGPLGGGTATAQQAAIAQIVEHIGVSIAPSDVEAIAGVIYGGTTTFRQGKAGSWREHLGPEHLAAAGPLLGDLLVDLGYEEDTSWWD